MYTHLVSLSPTNLMPFGVNRIREAGTQAAQNTVWTASEYINRSYQEADVSSWKNVELVLCTEESGAEAAAKVMAYFHPGKDVYISKITAMYKSTPSMPVGITVSEKGMVPR